MKKNILARCIAFPGIISLILFNAPGLKAQTDILDKCTQDVYDCLATGVIEIPYNFDGIDFDSIVVIQNISGFRLLDTSPTDQQYEFCAANNNFPCSTLLTNNGEFQIKFKYNSLLKAVKKVNFIIHDATSSLITVTAYQGSTPTVIPGDAITGGRRYVCENLTTPFDYIKIVSVYDAFLDPETQAFVLDELHIPTEPTVPTGTEDIDQFACLSIYPNPTPGVFTIEMDNQVFGELMIKIITQDGKEVQSIRFEKTTEYFSTPIDLSGPGKGMYLINLTIDKYQENRKVIVE